MRIRVRAQDSLAFIFLVLAISAASASPSVFPTGVTRYEPALAFNSYVLFDGRDGKTHLIDMDGHEVHQWDYIGFPSEMLDPQVIGGQLGHVLVQLTGQITHGPVQFGGVFNNREIAELDWDGKTVWKWGEQAPGGSANQNHDWERLPNGDTLIVASVKRRIVGFDKDEVTDQAIYEIAPSGELVWTWFAGDHISEFGFSPAGLRILHTGQFGSDAGSLTINDMQTLGPNRWFDNGDTRFRPGNIMFDARDGNFIAIIDKATGKLVWRLGPYYLIDGKPRAANILNTSFPASVDQISGQHDAHLIPKGLPGEGNLLVFDNQGEAGYPRAQLNVFHGSRVLEIDPISKQIIWQYSGVTSGRAAWTFDSSFISSARRLPNGNTLICEGMNGRIFQVTPSGQIVWEYVNPHFATSSQGGPTTLTNWTYRAQPIPYEWVPRGTPHAENPVKMPDVSTFRVPTGEGDPR